MSGTKIFLSGIPATGKTTLGALMAQRYGFKHFDMEANNGREADRLVADSKRFFRDLSVHSRVVITWGIPTRHEARLDEMRSNGFKVVWLDGDHEVSRRYFETRSSHPEQIEAYRRRMHALKNTNFVANIKPIILNPYTTSGQFKDPVSLIKEIISIKS